MSAVVDDGVLPPSSIIDLGRVAAVSAVATVSVVVVLKEDTALSLGCLQDVSSAAKSDAAANATPWVLSGYPLHSFSKMTTYFSVHQITKPYYNFAAASKQRLPFHAVQTSVLRAPIHQKPHNHVDYSKLCPCSNLCDFSQCCSSFRLSRYAERCQCVPFFRMVGQAPPYIIAKVIAKGRALFLNLSTL